MMHNAQNDFSRIRVETIIKNGNRGFVSWDRSARFPEGRGVVEEEISGSTTTASTPARIRHARATRLVRVR